MSEKQEKDERRTRRAPRLLYWLGVIGAVLMWCFYYAFRHHLIHLIYPGASITIIETTPLITEEFQLRNIFHHNTGKHYKTHRRLDITDEFISQQLALTKELDWAPEEEISKVYEGESPWKKPLVVSSVQQKSIRLAERDPDFVESYLAYAWRAGSEAVLKINLEWKEDVLPVPNVTDKDTVVSFALMSSNAYVEIPGTGDWRDVAEPWDEKFGIGWQDNGLRGQVFANKDNSTVVLSFKGTSAQYLSAEGVSGEDLAIKGSADTVPDDKINDNLLFSCCCARVSYMWTTVCDCYKSSYTCDQRCLEKEMVREDRYYRATLDVYRNVTLLYPDAQIYVTGHSLGGALASLLGRTYGLPVIAFEAPGELLATRRLHLPMPPGLPSELEHIWHFGNTADPIFMGVCNGASSSCSLAGYAMETQCHTGRQCVYDVVTERGFKISLLNHRIHAVIDDIILQYNETAQCKAAPPCHDCFDWRFVDDKKPSRTSTTMLPTGTSGSGDCLRRNWYGKCLEYDDGRRV